MSKLQCPFPNNLNPLSPNGFQLSITKLPGLTFFCQECPLPGMSVEASYQSTPFVDLPTPGDKVEFEPMNITFLVDEKMDNWKALYNWIKGFSFPESNQQYSDFINSQSNSDSSDLTKMYSDGSLIIYGNNLTEIQTVKFINLIPISIGELNFTNVSEDVQYLTASATFEYSYYEL